MKTLAGRRGVGAVCAVVALCLVGCGGKPSSAGAAPPTTPLTVAEWQTLGVEQKYWPETFERLRQGDPKLLDEREWERFFATVIVPARKVDIPIRPAVGKQ